MQPRRMSLPTAGPEWRWRGRSSPPARSSDSAAAVEGLPEDVRMAGMPRRLLDHVQQYPSQVAVRERRPGAGGVEVPLSSDLPGDGSLLIEVRPCTFRIKAERCRSRNPHRASRSAEVANSGIVMQADATRSRSSPALSGRQAEGPARPMALVGRAGRSPWSWRAARSAGSGPAGPEIYDPIRMTVKSVTLMSMASSAVRRRACMLTVTGKGGSGG